MENKFIKSVIFCIISLCLVQLSIGYESCSQLDTFLYAQDQAPKDISAVLSLMSAKVNHEITRVIKIEVRQEDSSQSFPLGTVGEHVMIAIVKRLNDIDNQVEELCFHFKFEITDIDECTLPTSHPMAAKCHESLECVNTSGSYECRCRGTAYGVPGGMGQCSGATNTTCCTEGTSLAKKEIQTCKAAFRCTESKCPGDCDPKAACTNSKDGKSFTCQCQTPYVGNGHECKFGNPPTVWKTRLGALLTKHGEQDSCECVWDHTQCGCTLPKVNYCHEVNCGAHSSCVNLDDDFKCVCEEGYHLVPGMGCANIRLPTLRLIGQERMSLRQCDSYYEQGVDIFNQNEETQSRAVDIEYSEPLGVCMRKVGAFHVNYTLATPWVSNTSTCKAPPPHIRLTRYVDVLDVDECTLPKEMAEKCPACKHRCSKEATCVNTIGSYTCKCPYCMQGDGYESGTGCTDSCAPVITVPEAPFYFRVVKCRGLLGDLPCKVDYEGELNTLVRQSGGKALCSSGNLCFHATDNSGFTTLDVTERVVLGPAIPLDSTKPGEYIFSVPYDVIDAAGNAAKTVFRKVIIQERTLEEIEKQACDNCLPRASVY